MTNPTPAAAKSYCTGIRGAAYSDGNWVDWSVPRGWYHTESFRYDPTNGGFLVVLKFKADS